MFSHSFHSVLIKVCFRTDGLFFCSCCQNDSKSLGDVAENLWMDVFLLFGAQ